MMVRQRGFSLVELMITSAIVGLVATVLIPLWGHVQQFMTSSEALVILKQTTLGDMRTIQRELECRLFFHGISGAPFLARVDMTGLPPLLNQSRLPNAYGIGSVAMAVGGASHSYGGNMLFMLQSFAPSTITGGGFDLKINKSRFILFYITEDPLKQIGGFPRKGLLEWKSVPYIDYEDMISLPPNIRSQVGTALYAEGLRYAFDSSALNPSTAFYDLGAAGGVSLNAGHLLVKSELVTLSKAVTGQTLSGYQVGICPNTDPSMGIKMVVPQFQNVRGGAPSGFEVFAGGPPEARQVLVRLVMVAAGGFPRILAHEQSTVTIVRDTP